MNTRKQQKDEPTEKQRLIQEFSGKPHENWGCDQCRLQTRHIKTIDHENKIIRFECTNCQFIIEKKIVSDDNHIATRKKHYENFQKENI